MDHYSSWNFELEGVSFVARQYPDNDHGAPWENEDGHGPVSDWTTRDKKPGEFVLSSDGRSKRFYDFQAALKRAKSEGWGHMPHKLKIDRFSASPYGVCGGRVTAGPYVAEDAENFNKAISEVYAMHKATMSKKQYAVCAVMADYENLKSWCDDQWHYCGVSVTVADESGNFDEEKEFEFALWGISSDDDDYLQDVAQELASDALAELRDANESASMEFAATYEASRPDLYEVRT